MNWQLAEAKNKLSEVVNRALSEGPQRIQRRGDVVIVISEVDYQLLVGAEGTFKDALLNIPKGVALDLERDPSPMRDVDL